jgi:hypothetical protein
MSRREWLAGTDYDSWYAEARARLEEPPDPEPPEPEWVWGGPEPDYEQILEDRAADRGPDPEAVMWGGEDIPS